MSLGISLDRESFQKLLGNAFAVQESRMETQLLSAIVEVQRLIKSGDLHLDGAMDLIAERTRTVASASGVAIGLLEGDRLVYRAGSGNAASFVGRHVMAALSASAAANTCREVLRVENAQTDARIEAAICRQFGANSLIMLLIYQNGAVAGMLQVFFNEAHCFQDREVRTYRMMAGLAGQAMSHAAQPDAQKAPAAELLTVPDAIQQTTSPKFPGNVTLVPEPQNQRAIYLAWGALMAGAGKCRGLWRQAGTNIAISQRVKHILSEPWSYAAVAGGIAMLATALWTTGTNRRPVAPSGASALQKSNAPEPEPVVAAEPAVNIAPKPRTTPYRVRSQEHEVDYVSGDVTVRYFTTRPARQPVLATYKQVDIGKDVTVRYFAPKTAVVPPTPHSARTGHHKTRL
jgi:hypothetical protein